MPLDIGVGIIFSLLVAHLFSIDAHPLLLLFGIACALLPDIDILPFLWPTNYNHRSFLHYPLLYVPLTGVVYIVLGPVYCTLFFLCVLAHFVHDTIGIGWGVAWGAPFFTRKFLFPEKGRRQQHGFFMSWLPQEEVQMATDHHDPAWVTTYYFRPNPIAYVEYGFLLVGLGALVFYYYFLY